MGSPKWKGNDNERPQHNVKVRDFYIGKYQITQAPNLSPHPRAEIK
jgi:formylglycine-generating enzyme required for sulfatase activity